jgi:hypothetical protein
MRIFSQKMDLMQNKYVIKSSILVLIVVFSFVVLTQFNTEESKENTNESKIDVKIDHSLAPIVLEETCPNPATCDDWG